MVLWNGKYLLNTRLRPSDSVLWCSTTEPKRLYGKRVHMTHILRTIRINYVYSVMFVNRMREMLCKEIEKDGFCLVMSVGQRKNSESPWGIAPQTFGFLAPMLYHWATETLWWMRSITKFIWHTSCIRLGSAMSIGVQNPKACGSIPHRDSELFLCLLAPFKWLIQGFNLK